MLKIFRMVSLMEGISFLLILSVTLGLISREYVFVLGMSHGAIFLLYFILSLLVSHKQNWSVTVWLLVLLAAFIPFAFIPVELFLKKELGKSQQNTNQVS
ncbi:DUF3817 domain-containing protein [Marinicella sp. S1101]|uniref:DUF3817 domain-containing protein n=1 Tax=Marinicella marina TaxID=2996016 RepID=UPI00226100FB|nr:DUF3817 domain-containing protein [Marinicella marina]MCX7552247.1 DUF3817 domain-containing protein [Marinicella marina]MDJ1139123.1 DUF3817 domain-containing protein [Marinicella marina]